MACGDGAAGPADAPHAPFPSQDGLTWHSRARFWDLSSWTGCPCSARAKVGANARVSKDWLKVGSLLPSQAPTSWSTGRNPSFHFPLCFSPSTISSVLPLLPLLLLCPLHVCRAICSCHTVPGYSVPCFRFYSILLFAFQSGKFLSAHLQAH